MIIPFCPYCPTSLPPSRTIKTTLKRFTTTHAHTHIPLTDFTNTPNFFRCATLLAKTPSKCSKMIESNVRRVLPVLTVFADWCSLNPRYLGYSALGRDGKCNRSAKSPSDCDLNPFYLRETVKASVEMMKAEDEARSSVMSCIVFLESFVKLGINSATGTPPTLLLLSQLL